MTSWNNYLLFKRTCLKVFPRIQGRVEILTAHSRYLHAEAKTKTVLGDNEILIGNTAYKKDGCTNVSEKILAHIERKLHLQRTHPLSFIKQRIIEYMYSRFLNKRRNPQFSVHDNISPVVSIHQNFDSLCIPVDHPSRSRNDTYYINSEYLLRAHTSAHQFDLIKSGLDNFLVVGDVYRKDSVDQCHYPVFHQVEAVRLRTQNEIFQDGNQHLQILENGKRTSMKQEGHTLEAVKVSEHEMKTCLEGLVKFLFGSGKSHRWVDAYFPFTHPSFELEIHHDGKWMELLGCGIMEQKLLESAGAGEKIGWAYGLGLERLAMILYAIPDIRLFWSRDSGFLSQFEGKDAHAEITYKPISKNPQCINDISFWIPNDYSPNNFYELVRNIGGDLVEQVALVDEFFHEKFKKRSHCYRIVYRHMEKALKQEEVNVVHKKIEEAAQKELIVELR